MAKARPTTEIRVRVRELARGFCEYCRIEEASTGHEFTLDHVSPGSLGGPTTPENLAYACIGCNVRKSNKTHAPDPIDGESAPLFNPRLQRWSDHFCWSSDTFLIVGLTPTGRATVSALSLNRPLLIK
jgi:5-methylcytosine-specific restriction endonuclease McrA